MHTAAKASTVVPGAPGVIYVANPSLPARSVVAPGPAKPPHNVLAWLARWYGHVGELSIYR